jgi:hypothetical protein
MPVMQPLTQDSVQEKHILGGRKGGGTSTAGGRGGGGGTVAGVIIQYVIQTPYAVNVAANAYPALLIDFPVSVKAGTDVTLNPFAWKSTGEREVDISCFLVATVNAAIGRYVLQILRKSAGGSQSVLVNFGANIDGSEVQMNVTGRVRMFENDELLVCLKAYNNSNTAQNLTLKRGEIKIVGT